MDERNTFFIICYIILQSVVEIYTKYSNLYWRYVDGTKIKLVPIICDVTVANMCRLLSSFADVASTRGYTYSEGLDVLKYNFLDAGTYNPRLRPEANTTVNVALNLLAVIDVDMKSQTVTTAGWLNVFWYVANAAWSTGSYHVDAVYLKDGDVWQPSLVAWNGALTSNFIGDDRLLVRATDSGKHLWEPPFLLKTHCEMDTTHFPFDSQKCSIVISTWGMTETEVTLRVPENNIKLTYYEENAEWSLDKSKCSAEKRVVSETIDGNTLQRSRLYFNIVLQRRSSFYGLYIFLPTIILSFLSVLSFVIPPSSRDKMSYAATIILAHFLELMAIITVVPVSKQVPVAVVYVIVNLVFSAVTIIMCAVISEIHHRDPKVMVSTVCRSATDFFACITCMNRSTPPIERKASLTKVKAVVRDDHKRNMTGVDDMDQSKLHEDGNIVALEKYPQPLPPLEHRFRKNKIIPNSAVSGEYIPDAGHPHIWKDAAKIWDRFFFLLFLIIAMLFHLSFILAIVTGNKT